MIRIGVCDDDTTSLEQIKQYLTDYQKTNLVVSYFNNGYSLLDELDSFDVILLDIDMPQINGIETAKKIREQNKDVILIYITNYSDYSVFAFAVHAFSYLLKPLKKEELFLQLDEIFTYRTAITCHTLEFITADGVLRLLPEQIFYFEYFNRHIYLHEKDATHMLKGKISTLETQLQSYGFYMPHKSFLVNLFAVKAIKGCEIILTNETILPLSQKKAATFKKKLNYYLSCSKRRILG